MPPIPRPPDVHPSLPSSPPPCPFCGYDLTGNLTNICPECGEYFNHFDADPTIFAESQARRADHAHLRHLLAAAAILTLLLVALAIFS